jgi:hypothetical protein
MKKPIHKSKLMWLGFIVTILGFVYTNFSVLQNVIDPKNYGKWLMGIGIAVQALRWYQEQNDK